MRRGKANSRSASSPQVGMAHPKPPREKRPGAAGDRVTTADEVSHLPPDEVTAVLSEHDQFSAILHGLADGITVQAPDGSLVYANAAAARLIGYPSVEELLAASVPEVMQRFELFDESGQPFPIGLLPSRRALAGETPPDTLLRFRVIASGEERWSNLKAAPVFDESGAVRYAVNVFHDVTEQKRTEAALRDSEAGYRLMFEGNPLPMWVFDIETLRFLAVNDAAVEHYGYTRDEFLSMTLLDVRPPEDVPPILDKVARVKDKATGLDTAGIWRHRTKSGSIIEMEVTTHALMFAGRPTRMSLNIDVTERRRTEAERERLVAEIEGERGRFEAVLRRMPAGVIVAEAPSGRLVLGNEQMERIWRQPYQAAPDLAGYRVYAGFHADGRRLEPEDWPLARTLRAGETIEDEEIDILRGDGTRGTIRAGSVPIRDRDGRMTAAVAILTDITEHKRTVERMARLQFATTALAEALTPMDVAEVIIEQGVAALGAQAAAIGLVTEDGNLEITRFAGYPADFIENWRRFPLDTPVPIAEVVRRGEAIWLSTPEEMLDHYPALAPVLAVTDSHAFAAVPLLVKGAAIGGIGLSFAEDHAFDEEDRNFALALARQCAQALERARLYEAEQQARTQAEAAQRRLAFLDQASTLLAGSLDYQVALADMARLAVPTLADWCNIDLLEEDGSLTRLAYADVNPERSDWARRRLGERQTPTPDAPRRLFEVARSGRSELYASVSDEGLAANARDDEHLAFLRSAGITSVIMTPIAARSRVLGVIVLVTAESGRRYGPADLAMAEDLARRVAAAVDNARLYDGEQRARRTAERAAERTQRLQAVTVALSEALTSDQVAEAVVEEGVSALGATAGSVVLVTSDGAHLEVARNVGYPPEIMETWRRFPLDAPVPLADAVRTVTPIWIESTTQWAERYPRLAQAQATTGNQAAAAIPLIVGGRAVGGMGLSFGHDQPFDEEDRAFVLALARQGAQALERARLYEAEQAARAESEAARERLAFLDEASTLLAGSLDYEATLTDVARLAVPGLADWCAIHMVQTDGSLSALAVAHVDPAKVAWAREIQERYPTDPSASYGVPHVVRTGRSELIAEISEDVLMSIARDEEHLTLLREVGLQSAMIVPLVARGRSLGAITLVATESDRHYGSADLALAEDVARRAAAAVDNARLYHEARLAEERVRRDAARLHSLAESSRAFAEEGLEYGALLETIARQITETVGDLCVIRLLSDDGAWFIPAAVYHADSDVRTFVHELLTAHPHPRREGLIGQVAQSGQPVLIASETPDEIRTLVRPEYRPIVDRLGIRATLIVPLRTRGRVDGAVVVMRAAANQPFTADDQTFLQDLADRAALAIDNARLYQQAQDAVRARDKFLSIAAHELRTPVAGVKGYAQMLRRAHERDSLKPSRLGQGLARIDQATNRLADLTNDLLDVSRIRLGQLPLRPRSLDLGAFAHEIASRYHDQITDHHRLILDVGDAPCFVHGDADRLEQVLTNLFDNAIKYSPTGGTIRVGLTPDAHDAGVTLSIQDDGIGLPLGGEASIFEPFGRADNAAAASIPGLGLGLYICRSIIERHNGRIWAESPGEDRGTTLRVWLPCGDGVSEGAEGESDGPPRPAPQ